MVHAVILHDCDNDPDQSVKTRTAAPALASLSFAQIPHAWLQHSRLHEGSEGLCNHE